jgi:hypothetical protein
MVIRQTFGSLSYFDPRVFTDHARVSIQPTLTKAEKVSVGEYQDMTVADPLGVDRSCEIAVELVEAD